VAIIIAALIVVVMVVVEVHLRCIEKCFFGLSEFNEFGKIAFTA
jgi:hypothetical protein